MQQLGKMFIIQDRTSKNLDVILKISLKYTRSGQVKGVLYCVDFGLFKTQTRGGGYDKDSYSVNDLLSNLIEDKKIKKEVIDKKGTGNTAKGFFEIIKIIAKKRNKRSSSFILKELSI